MFKESKSRVILNPFLPHHTPHLANRLLKATTHLTNHIWIATSGSDQEKWVGLSRSAIFLSAENVNKYLEISKEDIWVNPLPYYHIGGLAIWARAHLNHTKVYSDRDQSLERWDPHRFIKALIHRKGTLTSLVPTQLFDLTQANLSPPQHLRLALVGGDRLDPSLYERAIHLNWPIIPTYGMTECASQVATTPLSKRGNRNIPPLQVLPHIHLKIDDQRICLHSESLFSTYASLRDGRWFLEDPKCNGWFITEDTGSFDDQILQIFGRESQWIKIGGERILIPEIEQKLLKKLQLMNLQIPLAIVPLPHERLGHTLHLTIKKRDHPLIETILHSYQLEAPRNHHIHYLHLLDELPLSGSRKILHKSILAQIEKDPHGLKWYSRDKRWAPCEDPSHSQSL